MCPINKMHYQSTIVFVILSLPKDLLPQNRCFTLVQQGKMISNIIYVTPTF